MSRGNYTEVTDFILMGLTESEDIKLVLFVLFLLIYLVTALGNGGMILLIHLDVHLHTPMYFFLSHLSFIDLNYSFVITPKTLENLSSSNKKISYTGCYTQLYFMVFFVSSECILLASMAYDRYVAICNPLHYPVVMSRRRCWALVAGSYLVGLIVSIANRVCMSWLHFCNSNVIYHYFCDISPMIALSCTDTWDTQLVIFVFGSLTFMISLITISVSYVSILSTILKIKSTAGKRKAFSTCGSHVVAVTIFYSTLIFTYLKPSESYTLGRDQVISVFYTIVTPMLNPLIYSIRNKEVKNAVLRLWQKAECCKHLNS